MVSPKQKKGVQTDLIARAKKIKVILMDVDGVLTNGLIYFVADRDNQLIETKGFDSQDGLGLLFCHAVGIKTGVISGRHSPSLAERAHQLKITYVYQDRLKKQKAYEEIINQAQVAEYEVSYIGDDLTDLPLMKRSGLACAVSNARTQIKMAAHYTTSAKGGRGAVREVIELILNAQNLWQKALAEFEINF